MATIRNAVGGANALTDRELAERIVRGDGAAFELLMRRNNRRLFRTARSIVGSDSEAEDVVQDTYVIAYKSMPRYRGEARLSTWLTRIAVNEALQRKRTHKGVAMSCDNVIDLEKRLAELHAQRGAETPERLAIRQETRRILEQKIDELPAAYRTIFVLRAVEELPFADIAASLSLPEATVRTRFFRARAMLREAVTTAFYLSAREAFFFEGAQCDRIVQRLLSRLGLDHPM